MAEKQLSGERKKEWAKQLFMIGEHTQKEIAAKIGVNEKTICRWVESEKWDVERKSLNVTTAQIIADLKETLDAMRKEAKVFATDDDPATRPDTDGIYKITLAIKNLENKTGIGETILCLQDFVKFISADNLELAQDVTKWADLFIESRLKTV